MFAISLLSFHLLSVPCSTWRRYYGIEEHFMVQDHLHCLNKVRMPEKPDISNYRKKRREKSHKWLVYRKQ